MAAPTTPPPDGSVNPLLGILAALGGALGGRAISNNSASASVPPELRQLLKMQVDRQAYQNPNFQAVTQGVHAMLPNFATDGAPLSGSLSNQAPAMPPGGSGGGGSNPLANPAIAGLLGKALGDAAGGNIPFKDIIDQLKKLFGGKQPGHVDNSNWLPNYDPFNSNGNWNGMPPEQSGGNLGHDDGSQPFLPSDPGFYVGGGQPTDPSGGTGIGPGMQNYYNSGGGGGDNYGTNPWDE